MRCFKDRAGSVRPVFFVTVDVAHHSGDRDCAVDSDYAAAWVGERFDKHKVIAKWTLPLWFYVCMTGVIVYCMVYQLYAPIRV